MKKTFVLLILSLVCMAAWAQSTGTVQGTALSRVDRAPLAGVKVTLLLPVQAQSVTDADGRFSFADVPDGVWEMTLEANGYQTGRATVRAMGAATKPVTVTLLPSINQEELSEDNFAEFDTETGNDASQSMPVVLSASKDVFDQLASYTFGQMRFRPRGLETTSNQIFFNGILLNDAQSGYSPYSLWGGLNDATRNQVSTSGVALPDVGVGSVDGSSAISATASQVARGWRVGLANTNATYRLRGSVTYASGERKGGWSYAFSAAARWGGNDWVRGVSYNSVSYFASVEKKLNRCNSLALTFLGAPTERGTQAAATQETYDLVGSNYYNPNWGFQGGNGDHRTRSSESGQMRNARVRKVHEPLATLNYKLKINPQNTLTASASYRFGRNGYTALDWYTGVDPRPDYYRKLPSYFISGDPTWEEPGSKYNWIREGWQSDWNIRQVNWDALYRMNYESVFTQGDVTSPAVINGTRRSMYIVAENRADQRDANIDVQLFSLLSDNYTLRAGAAYRWNRTEYFRSMDDLLGGDYYLDLNKYSDGDYGSDIIQNDIDHPNRLIKQGDKFGYDYYGFVRTARAWASLRLVWRDIEAYAAAEGGRTDMWREGLYRTGVFPDDSKGESSRKDFWTYTAKAGLTYKISGTHVVWANLAAMQQAPYFLTAMTSPRTRNEWLPGLSASKTLSADINYSLRTRWIRMRLTGYAVNIKDQSDVISFYDDTKMDEGTLGVFTNFAMSGIDQLNTGIEWGFQVPLVGELNLKGGLSYGYWIYTSNPRVTQTVDNSARVVLDNQPVYWKKYKVAGAPQTAAGLGLDYRTGKNLFLNLTGAYYDANYVSMNPVRRTDQAIFHLSPEQIEAMTHQERYDPAFVLSASVGKYWILKGNMLGFNLSADNILNNKNIRSGGYEQMRLKKTTDDISGVTTYSPFDSKYFYLLGANYYLNIYYRF